MSANIPYSDNTKGTMNVYWVTVGDNERENFVNSLSNKLKLFKLYTTLCTTVR